MSNWIDYNGYQILVDQRQYQIRERLSTGKYKVRRRSAGNKIHGKDRHGNILYKDYLTDHEAITNAKNYIDNHIVKWETKNNPS